MKQFWLILAVFLGLASTAVPASADIQWTLNCSDTPCTGSNATNNFGTVVAKQIGTGSAAYVEVTITLASTATTKNLFLATGSHTGIDWNMSTAPNAISGTPAGITIMGSNSSKFTIQSYPGSYADAPFSNGGNFQYAITPTASKGSEATENSIVFDLKRTGGLALTTGLFTPNGGGYYWAVDIGRSCSVGDNGKSNCASTGVVAANSYVQVPEPGTWTMSIAGLTGLMGLMMLRRRKLARA